MKVLIQRVKEARVTVAGQLEGEIGQGLLLLVGIEHQDNDEILLRMAEKILKYRIFPDSGGKMNRCVKDISGSVLSVSQFTLVADTHKGLRPGFSRAAKPGLAQPLYERFNAALRTLHSPVATGIFGADMQVQLTNDGPLTFLLEM